MIKQPRILIIEDLPNDAELAMRELQKAQISFQSKRVETKEAFLKELEDFKPDLVLSDFSLPQFNALDAFRLLQTHNPNIPFILYTGSLTEEVAVECIKEGISDYILKSSLKRLPSSILNILEKQEAKKKKEEAIKALRDSEEQFRSIVETTNERIWAADMRGRMTYNNPAVERLLGYHPDELMGKNALHFIHKEDHQNVNETINRSVSGKKGWINFVCRWRHKDGGYRYMESNSVPMFDGNGELIGYRGADRDITERKLFEQELKANEMRLAEAQRIANVGSFEWNLPEDKLIYSAEFYRILNVKPEDFGTSFDDYIQYIHPEDIVWVKQKIRQVIYEKTFTPYEHRIIRSEGTVRYIYVTGIVTFNEIGNPVKVTGIIHDITDRKKSDIALQESEYKLRTLVESMSEGLLQVDGKDHIQFVNNCFCEMVGYTETELLGTDWTQLLPEEERDFIKQVNERRRQGIADRYEIRLQKKTGGILWTIVGGAPLIDADCKVIGSMGTFTDITERKRAEEQLLHDAFHDGLTGLANRTLFMDHLRLTIDRNKRKLGATFAVLFLDFDRFKVVNTLCATLI